MEQLIIAYKKLREAARLLAAANERALPKRLRSLRGSGGPAKRDFRQAARRGWSYLQRADSPTAKRHPDHPNLKERNHE